MNKSCIESLAMQYSYMARYFNTLSFFSGLLASVVHIVMAQCYKGYTNIVDVFGSLPPTQLNRFAVLVLKQINNYQITAVATVFTCLPCNYLDQLNQVIFICGKHGRSAMIPVLLDIVIPYMVESLLSAIATLFNILTQLACYLHIA